MSIETIKISDLKMSIATLCRTLRKRQSLSRNDLAELLHVSRITIQNLETGKNVTIDTLLKVLQYFDLLDKFDAFLSEEINNNSYKSLY